MEGLIWIHENLHGLSWLNRFYKYVTYLGEGGILWIVLALVLICFKNSRKSGVVLLISLAVGFVINDLILKNIFERTRPFIENVNFGYYLKQIGMQLPTSYSMPSGHAYSAFNCAVILTMFDRKWSGLIGIATLIAFSRIFLCIHYPTDVLVGVILGILTAVCVFILYKLVERKIEGAKRNKIRKQ